VLIASAFLTLCGVLCWFLFGPMALNGAEFVDFVKNQMFINPGVFDERVLQTRSSKTLAFIAIQFGGGLADNVPN
jgi:hypothetical protein